MHLLPICQQLGIIKKNLEEVYFMADWAMVVLTGIYVIATIFICRFNYGATQASKEQAAEMRRQYDEDNRPYITVELIYERRAFFGLRFSNHGKRLADHVRIQFKQEFINSIAEPSFKKIVEQTRGKECIIGIGQHYDLFFGSNAFLKNSAKVNISGEMLYSDGKRSYSETFSIDFDSYATLYYLKTDTDDFLNEMKAQTKELKSIKDTLKELNATLKSLSYNSSDNVSE